MAPRVPLLLLFLLASSASARRPPTLSFTADLIHRSSPQSPFYNSSLSPADILRASAHRSIARSHRFGLSSASPQSDFSAPISPDMDDYLMSISMGTPPFDTLAVADTGSDVTWVQCEPCKDCYKQKPPKFDPAKSSTYKNVSCKSDTCSLNDEPSCTDDGGCRYEVNYGDGSYSVGLLATETLTFKSGGRQPATIPGIAVGCSHSSGGTFSADGGGLVGLGGGPLSLTSQLSGSIDGKFAYCLVPYSTTGKSSTISFGTTVSGGGAVSTPIRPMNPKTYYYLSLESITVGGVSIDVPLADMGNIIIDSGTTLTLLPSSTYSSLVAELMKIIHLPIVPDPSSTFDHCFKVGGGADGALPDMVFNFHGASVTLTSMNTFVDVEGGVSCLAIADSGGSGVPIFGNVAQQGFQVGYDLVNKEVTFKRTDCTAVV